MKQTICTLLLIAAFFAPKAQDISDSLHVAHYNLNLNITDFTNKTIYGNAALNLVTKINALSQFNLDLEGLTVDSILIAGTPQIFSQQGYKLHIPYNSNQGDTTLVRIYYHGAPIHDASWGGFYYSGDYCYNMGVAFTSQPHNFGRCWYPCLDVFTDKSTYTMNIETEPGKMAVCNGLLTDSTTLSNGNKRWTWVLEQPIPTYLASVAVGPYRLYADTFQGQEATIPIEIYAQPSTINNVAGSFIHLKDVLRMYESLFGPYRWPRVGYVAVNFTSGAMEHATNIAYPNAAINGNTTQEDLYAHELFHLWFGDLITCSRAEEMWINEGFASYAEALTEGLLKTTPENDAYLNYIRNVHHTTLKNIVKDDGSHYALDNVPQEVTYGTHSYQKGSLIVHTLRNYMGDSLFFNGFTNLLEHYAYQNITSEGLFDYLTQVTGVPLHDFYEGWVHQPGFLHFSIDSIRSLSGNQYRVYLHQKLCAGTHFANNNKLDLTFVSADRSMHTIGGVIFSGEFDSIDVNIPFTPMFGMVDYFEKITDATIDYTQVMAAGDTKSFSDALCTVRLENSTDSILVRVEHNYVTPDHPEVLPEGIFRMSDSHYWTIALAYNQQGAVPTGKLQFRFQKGNAAALDYSLFSDGYTVDNLKVLYREDCSKPWQIIAHTRTGSAVNGLLTVEQLLPGQYCFAVGDITASLEDNTLSNSTMSIYPNPVSEVLCIYLDGTNQIFKGSIYDTTGKVIKNIRLKPGSNRIPVSAIGKGLYLVGVKDAQGHKKIATFVKE